MENIVEGGDCDALMRKFSDWHANGYMTPHGKCFDDGHTTFAAIKAFRKGTPASKCGRTGEEDNGNGSLMRIAPVALMNIENPSLYSRIEIVEKYSGITHAHPRSVLGCILYTEFLRLLYFRKDKYAALGTLPEIVSSGNYPGICYTEYASELSHYDRILYGDISKLKREDIQSDGNAVHTLEAALWCFLRNDNFRDTVLEAVNLGKDTDTTAMVAGSMAGMFYGLNSDKSIPEEWRRSLAKFEGIVTLCHRFETKITQSTFTDPRDGKTYKTVKMGEQIWMAENFNHETEGSAYYNDDPVYGEKYGQLYDFETAKRVCPVGWHLPSTAEWCGLTNYVDYCADSSLDFHITQTDENDAGRYLKAKQGWNDYYGKSGNGEDTFGFAALPGGSYNFKGSAVGLYGLWWSATKCEDDNELAWSFSMDHNDDGVQEHNTWIGDKLSVRYVKD